MAAYNGLSASLSKAVEDAVVGPEVAVLLLPLGVPHDIESQYWDYKEKLPSLRPRASEEDKAVYKAEMCDLVKDAVAFYNATGGYLVFGVKDKGRDRVVGCYEALDCGDFNKRVEGAIGHNFECIFRTVDVPNAGPTTKVGVLYVPRRPDGTKAAAFRKAAAAHPLSKAKAYQANDVYVRIRDESRPATATSADWEFLHGPRRLVGAAPSVAKRPMRVTLPARDPDLIHFIGRETYLAELRSWLGDSRSPVRLLTGIGGLGKTSIAYRFVEEVVDTRAGDIEQVLWLTAKARTFSALRGELVEAGRVDFTDTETLYTAILRYVGYEPDWGDDEPDIADRVEAIVEALSTYNCLIVIDDIDSLSADDQREVVYTLSGAAMRTVSGDKTPSRMIFTSRIDQGLAPASVIKVRGFERAEFDAYVSQVSERLGVPLPKELNFEVFYTATSGSPLFAASVLRLVRLGTDFIAALDRWRGEEGVEVRRFAFERELQQLPPAAARLLYAICLLGETTTIELSQILEISSNSITSSVASLQSFHLVITQLNSKAGSVIKAPDDVVLTQDVLERHLGSAATHVQSACAAARARAENSEKNVASRIGQIVSLWKGAHFNEALVEAEKLSKDFPGMGDVTCLNATALTRAVPPRWAEADSKFQLAQKQKCSRPELVEGWIATKINTEDWSGLLALATSTVSTRRGEDIVLRAYIRATDELIKIARLRGDRARRKELAEKAIEMIRRRTDGRAAGPDRDALFNKKLSFARTLFDDVRDSCRRPGDQITIFDTLMWLAEREIFLTEFVRAGLAGLNNWWGDVEGRPFVDDGAKSIIKKSLSRLEQLERILVRFGKEDLSVEAQHLRFDLAHRAAKMGWEANR